MLTGQLLPAPPPAVHAPAAEGLPGFSEGRVAVRAALRSDAAEVVAAMEADLAGLVQDLFQGACTLPTPF